MMVVEQGMPEEVTVSLGPYTLAPVLQPTSVTGNLGHIQDPGDSLRSLGLGWFGLNCVPPQKMCWRPNPQCLRI